MERKNDRYGWFYQVVYGNVVCALDLVDDACRLIELGARVVVESALSRRRYAHITKNYKPQARNIETRVNP